MESAIIILKDGDEEVEAKLPRQLLGHHTKLSDGAELDISNLDDKERALLNGIAKGDPLGDLGITLGV